MSILARRRDTQNEAGRRNQPIVRAENCRPQPADAMCPVSFSVSHVADSEGRYIFRQPVIARLEHPTEEIFPAEKEA